MSSSEAIPMEGVVLEMNRGVFIIQVDDRDHKVSCTIAGKIRKNQIKVSVGDRVRIEVTPYDLGKGRITFRL